MMLVPSFLFWSGHLSRPLMVEGDQLQEQPCPVCRGTDTKCKRCHGKGVINFIVPGPQRPTHVVGHVYGNDQQPRADVNVTVEIPPHDPIKLRTDATGRFGVTLPPGNFTLKLNEGATQQIHIDPQTKPVPADEQVTFPVEDRPYQM